MRLPSRILGISVALLVGFVGCASEPRSRDAPSRGTNALPASFQDQGRAVLIEADRQMAHLGQSADSSDPFVHEAMMREMADLRVRSDRLRDDMTMDDGRGHEAAIRADLANLRRTMSAAANAERQAEPDAVGSSGAQ